MGNGLLEKNGTHQVIGYKHQNMGPFCNIKLAIHPIQKVESYAQ